MTNNWRDNLIVGDLVICKDDNANELYQAFVTKPGVVNEPAGGM